MSFKKDKTSATLLARVSPYGIGCRQRLLHFVALRTNHTPEAKMPETTRLDYQASTLEIESDDKILLFFLVTSDKVLKPDENQNIKIPITFTPYEAINP